MELSRRLLPSAVLVFVIGAVALSRFSQNVRAVDAVGLTGSGFAFGVGFTLLLFGLTGRIRQ